MKTLTACIVVALLVMSRTCAWAQFKGQVEREAESSGGIITQPSSLFLGWFDPDKFSMHHAVNISYMSLGGQGMALSTYTNSMMYRFADNFNVQTDISMSYSPTKSLTSFNGKGNSDLSGVYLSRAELNYRPWNNVLLEVQYRQMPFGSYAMSPFNSFWFRENGF